MKWLIILLAVCSGCVSNPGPDYVDNLYRPQQGPTWYVENDFNWSALSKWEWLSEINERFNVDNTVIYISHGGFTKKRGWFITNKDGVFAASAVDRAWELRERYPNKNIVLLACNPGQITPQEMPRGVYYAIDNVWIVPDRSIKKKRSLSPVEQLMNDMFLKMNRLPWYRDTESREGWVGSIWEFQEGTCSKRPR